MNLDIADFGVQVLTPITAGIVDAIGGALATAIAAATYANEIDYAYSTDDAWDDVLIPAREYLNKAHVPMTERYVALGANVESAFLKTDLFVKANESGGTDALSDATLGRKAGFTIVSAPELDPDEAYAYHSTAFALTNQAPAVPQGAAWGAQRSMNGFAMRVVQGFDLDEVEDRTIFDSWLGVTVVTDNGSIDASGVFTPSEDPDDSGMDDLVVRAVKISGAES